VSEERATQAALNNWRGIYPSICTPFTEDDRIDLDAQRRIVRFALACGAHGLVAFGLAGEVLKLTPEERRELAEAIIDEAGQAVPVFVGVGAPSTRVAIELARHAEEAGADCIVVPAPMSGALDADALIDYVVRVATAVEVPVMVQDAPAYVGVTFGIGAVRAMAARADNVRLLKIEAGPSEMRRWIDDLPDGFSVWGGDGGIYTLDCVRSGAAGIIPGVDLVDLLVRVYEAEAQGDIGLADERLREVLPMLVFQIQHSIDHYNACAKHVLVQRGVLEHGGLRPPAGALGEVSRMLLERHLAGLQLTAGGIRAE